jgi:hypothetical protein
VVIADPAIVLVLVEVVNVAPFFFVFTPFNPKPQSSPKLGVVNDRGTGDPLKPDRPFIPLTPLIPFIIPVPLLTPLLPPFAYETKWSDLDDE